MTGFARLRFNRRLAGAASVQAIGIGGASLITLVTYSILTRMYAAEDFGLVAIYLALIALAGPVSTGRYEVAILLPESRTDALSVALVAMSWAVAAAAAVALLVLLFPALLPGLAGSSKIGRWQWIVPAGLLFSAAAMVSFNLSLREGSYRIIAAARIGGALVVSAIGIGGGVLALGGEILLYAQLLGSVATIAITVISLGPYGREVGSASSVARLKALGSKYIAFPKLSIPADFLGVASRNLPLLVFSHLFGEAATGLLSLSHRAIGAAANVVGKALGEVFRKEAAAERIRSGSFQKLFVSSLLWMSLAALALFLPVLLLGPYLFAFVFGETWYEAGVYAAVLVPLYAASFIGGNLGWTVYVVERQIVDVVFQGGLLLAMVISGVAGLVYGSPLVMLAVLSLSSAAVYIAYVFVCYRLSGVQAPNSDAKDTPA